MSQTKRGGRPSKTTMGFSKSRRGRTTKTTMGSQNSSSTAWGPGKATGCAWQDTRPGGRGNIKSQSPNIGWEKNYMAPPTKITPPLQHGWQWGARDVQVQPVQPDPVKNAEDDINYEDDEDMIEDIDDDIYSDGFDSDESEKSHETRKKNKWFKKFFNILDKSPSIGS